MDRLPDGDSRFDSILFSSEAIGQRIREMAGEIHRVYPGEEPLLLVGILKGACPFQMDLARALSQDGMRHIQLGMLRASTYGSGMKEEGEATRSVKIEMVGMPEDARQILLLDDLLDQGYTLSSVKELLQKRYPDARIRVAVFLKKKLDSEEKTTAARRRGLEPDFYGFTIPDRWVVGYGMDLGEEFRELPYVATVFENRFL